MTQNDLLQIAMPLVSLSNKEWDVFNELLENTEPETELHKVLTTLCNNQARLEVSANYRFYFQNQTLPDESVEI